MDVYQNFLDFFATHNKERLDGLSENYFTEMTQEERDEAFDFLMARTGTGGSEETIHGLFRANPQRAVESVGGLLAAGKLNDRAQIAAAWNLWRLSHDASLIPYFIGFMTSPEEELREKAAYYVPAEGFDSELKAALQGMIRSETRQLARIHAVDKLLACYGVSAESTDKKTYLRIYKNLHSEDLQKNEAAFLQLDDFHGAA